MPTVLDLMRRLHCSPDTPSARQFLCANFRAQGFVIASDGGALIAIPEETAPTCDSALPSNKLSFIESRRTQFVATPNDSWQPFDVLLSHPKLQSLESCKLCKGKGWLVIRKCKKCNGQGELKRGKRFHPCSKCEETGTVYCPTSCTDDAHACDFCQGDGQKPKKVYYGRYCNIPLPGFDYCHGIDGGWGAIMPLRG